MVRKPGPAEPRFWDKVLFSDGCWEWDGSVNSRTGYGRFWTGVKQDYAHRFSYELNVGDIPAGLVIDHLCKNHRCVRPRHLEVVSHRTNCLRGTVGWNLRRENRTNGVACRGRYNGS